MKSPPISDDALTIEAVGVPYSGGSPDSNLNNEDGAAVAVTGDAKYTGDIDVNISGGTFNSTYGIAFWAYNSDGKQMYQKSGYIRRNIHRRQIQL